MLLTAEATFGVQGLILDSPVPENLWIYWRESGRGTGASLVWEEAETGKWRLEGMWVWMDSCWEGVKTTRITPVIAPGQNQVEYSQSCLNIWKHTEIPTFFVGWILEQVEWRDCGFSIHGAFRSHLARSLVTSCSCFPLLDWIISRCPFQSQLFCDFPTSTLIKIVRIEAYLNI